MKMNVISEEAKKTILGEQRPDESLSETIIRVFAQYDSDRFILGEAD